jgi:hypothetical protein
MVKNFFTGLEQQNKERRNNWSQFFLSAKQLNVLITSGWCQSFRSKSSPIYPEAKTRVVSLPQSPLSAAISYQMGEKLNGSFRAASV